MPVDWETRSPFFSLTNRLFYGKNPSVTSQDIQTFSLHDPVNGARMASIRSAGMVVNGSAVAGGLAGAAFLLARTRNIIFGAVGFAGGAVSGYILGDGIATWTHGLYKFDVYQTNIQFIDWCRAQKH